MGHSIVISLLIVALLSLLAGAVVGYDHTGKYKPLHYIAIVLMVLGLEFHIIRAMDRTHILDTHYTANQQLITDCEATLPRDQNCVIIAVPLKEIGREIENE